MQEKKVSKIFLWYLISAAIIEFSCNAVGVLFPSLNLFISHLYFGFQLVFLSALYYHLISNKIFKKLIVIIAFAQLSYLTYAYLSNTELFWTFNTYEIVSTSFILIVYAVYFIFSSKELMHKYYNFSIGLILYLSCSIAIFLSGKLELVICEEPYIDIWIFNSLFFMLFQYFIFREFMFVKNQAKIKVE